MRWLPTLAFFLAVPVAAQSKCPEGTATSILDANNIPVVISNHGEFFRDKNLNQGGSMIPGSAGPDMIFSASLWIAGTMNSELRAIASKYGESRLGPGPIELFNCTRDDRIYSLTDSMLDLWLEHGELSPDMLDWPWELGAPVVDGDGNPDNYNLEGGDLPELLGDERHWWIMNDTRGRRQQHDTAPLEFEIRGTAFSSRLSSSVENTVFLRFEVTNQNNEALKDGYVALFVDSDVELFTDDYVGSDTTLGMGFSYNASDHDNIIEDGVPPAVGVIVLEAPVVHRLETNKNGSINRQKSSYM